MLSTSTTLTLLALFAGISMVNAHGHVKEWVIGGVSHPGYNPSNPPMYGKTAERPSDNSDQGFTDYKSTSVACGGASAGSGLDTWDVNAGDSVTAVWDTWPSSHKGPVTEALAKCPDSGCDGVDAASLKWFKISEADFDGTAWPTDKLVSSLQWNFKIPTDIAPGAYLVRHSIVAMHTVGAPQVYPYCFQANIASSGSVVPTETSTFPAWYTENDDFLTWNLYGGDQSAFVPPGPAVYSGASSGGSPAPAPAPSPSPAPKPSTSAAPAPGPSSAPEPSPSASPSAASSAAGPVVTDVPGPVDPAPSPSPSPAPSSSAAPAPAPSPSPAPAPGPGPAPVPTPDGSLEMGGPVPPVTAKGSRYETLGGSYHDQKSALTAACMEQMNRCKRWANSLPNSEVSAAMPLCDAQERECETSAPASKRDQVINRYLKRGLRLF